MGAESNGANAERKVKVGFTGTQRGVNARQRRFLAELLMELRPDEFHHGDCVGADCEAHMIAETLRVPAIVIHPPVIDKGRAFCGAHVKNRGSKITWRELKQYLVRNRAIVEETDVLIAVPRQDKEVL